MEFDQIKELIKMLQGTNISEFKFEKDDVKVSIRTKHSKKEVVVQPSMPMQMPMMPAMSPMVGFPQGAAPMGGQETAATKEVASAETSQEAPAEKKNVQYMEIKSPMVGTFYRKSSPEKPALVKVGDVIAPDDVLCLVEAMKLFNEVKSEVSGRVVKVLVEDSSPVEYDQVLFLVEPLD